MLASVRWEYEFNAATDPTSRRVIRSVENAVTQPAARMISKYTYTVGAEARRDEVMVCLGQDGGKIEALASRLKDIRGN